MLRYVRDRNYRKLQKRTKDLVTKELDLMNAIKRSRMLTFSVFSLLSSTQRAFVSQLGRNMHTIYEIDLFSDGTELPT